MRVLIAALPAYGHLLPLLPLASSLRHAGHDVVLATGEPLAARLESLGWDVRRVLGRVEDALLDLASSRPDLMRVAGTETWRLEVEVLAEALPRRTGRRLLAVLDDVRPDLVVYGETDLGAAAACAAAGVPAVRHGLGPRQPAHLTRAWAEAVHRHATALGGTPPEGPAVLGAAELDIHPDALADPQLVPELPRVPLRPVPFTGPTSPLPVATAADLDAAGTDRPLVLLTMGTTPLRRIGVLAEAARGLTGLDVDVVVAVGPSGDTEELRAAGGRVRIERFVDQDAVLCRAAVVVHHGGSGTTLGAAGCGVPQLVLPQGPTAQSANARAVVRAGIGRSLDADAATGSRIAEEVRELLGDAGTAGRAGAVAEGIAAMPGPDDVVPSLVDIAGQAAGAVGSTHGVGV